MSNEERNRPEMVTASEVASFACCAEQWRLEHGLGLKRTFNNNFSISSTMTLPLCHSDQGGKERCTRPWERCPDDPSLLLPRLPSGTGWGCRPRAPGDQPDHRLYGRAQPAARRRLPRPTVRPRGNHSAGADHGPGSQHDRPRPTRVGPGRRAAAGPGAATGGRSQARGGPTPGIVTALEELLADVDRRGSRLRHEVDAPLARHTPKGPQAPGVQGLPFDHRSADARPGLLVADLPQEQGGDPPQGPGSAVPLPGAAAEAVPGAGMARDQRRYQEEGAGR